MSLKKNYILKFQKCIKKSILYFLFIMLVFSLTGCGKEDNMKVQKTKNNIKKSIKEKEKFDEASILYKENTEPMTNNPYNALSSYFDGYTYIQKGISIYRIADGSDDMKEIYSATEAAMIGFVIHKDDLYVYEMIKEAESGYTRTEINRMNIDGTAVERILDIDGGVVTISFYNDDMYIWTSGTEGSAYKGYHLNNDGGLEDIQDDEDFLYHKVNLYLKEEDNFAHESNAVLEPAFSEKYYGGIFYLKHQKTELPIWNVNFETKEKVSDILFECYGQILVTPFGIYKVSEDGNSILKHELGSSKEVTVYTNTEVGMPIQLFTYDDKRIYFSVFSQDGSGDGCVYSISGYDDQVKSLVKLQEEGISVPDSNSTKTSLYLNVQNGYIYIWTDLNKSVIRKLINV